MHTTHTLLVDGALSAILSAALARAIDLRPVVATNLRGTLRLQQSVPFDQIVDLTTNVEDGRLEMTPALGLDVEGGDKVFNLTSLTLFFTPFNVDGDCRSIRD